MKRISFLAIIYLLCASPMVQAQTPANLQEIEENYKHLKATVDDYRDAQEAQRKELESLRKDISELRVQSSKPSGNYANQEDLKRLADAVQEIDRKREADKELILKKLSDLGRTLTAVPPSNVRPKTPKTTPPPEPVSNNNGGDAGASGHESETGYEYLVKSGDTFSVIAQAYREKGVKVTTDQIVKANPNVNPAKLKVGQKLWIPGGKAPTK